MKEKAELMKKLIDYYQIFETLECQSTKESLMEHIKQLEQELKELFGNNNKKLIKEVCRETINELERQKRIENKHNSFSRTEKLLYMYGQLENGNQEKAKIETALQKIEDDDYKDIIKERYFEGLTFENIAEIYGVSAFTISRHRTRLIRILAKYLFPEEVVREILDE